MKDLALLPDIAAAVRSQLPRQYADCPVWWPLSLPDGEYYIKGNLLVTLEEYQRCLALALEGAA